MAIGTIADLMPMINENRILVRRGMQQLTEGNRNAITAFFGVQNLLGKKISTTDIGWQVSPVFNAAGRLGVPGKTVDLLLESDSERCHILSRELVMLNRERKKIGDQAWVKLFPKAEKSYNENRQRFILLTDRDLNRGITGIIAARLMNHFNVPAVVIARLENKWIGSVRSNVMLNVKEFLAEFDDLLIDYGGHPRAGGFSVSDHNLEVLLKRMYQTSREMKESRVDESLQIDAEIPHEYMNPSLIDVVERLEPYGEENRPLQFLLQRANIESVSLIGNGEVRHLKLLVSSGKYKWPAVYWKAGERLGSLLQPGHTVDIVFRLGRNYYRNTENLQLTVIDLKLSNSGAVDKAQ